MVGGLHVLIATHYQRLIENAVFGKSDEKQKQL